MSNRVLPAGRSSSRTRTWLVAGLLSLGSLTAAQTLTDAFEDALGNRLQPLTVSFAAPGSRAVHLTAGDGSTDDAYTVDIPVVDGGLSQEWTIELQALPDRHPDAKHDELWVFAIQTPERRLRWQDVDLTGRWDLQPSMAAGAMDKHVAVATGSQSNRLTATIAGSRLVLVVGQGEYSGKARISVNGDSRVVDLYATSFRLTELTFLAPAPADYGTRPHALSIPRGLGREVRLAFSAENGPVQIADVALDGRPPSAQTEGSFRFAIPGWPPPILARVAMAIVGLLLVAACVTGVAAFSRQDDQPPPRAPWDLWFAASFALSAATIGTLLFYPGIFNEDALTRWSSAMALRDGEPLSSLGSLYPPLMAMVMAALQSLSGEYGLATLVQAFFFYFCFTLVCFDLLGTRPAVLAAPLLAVLPPIAVNALSLSADTCTASALMACATIIWRRRQRDARVRELTALLLFAVSCVVLFGFRYNTLALVPVLLLLVWSIVGHKPLRVALVAVAIASAAGTAVLPQLIGTHATRLAAIPMLWEHVGMMKEVGDRRAVQAHRLDGLGDTERALSIHSAGAPDNLVHGPDAPFPYSRVIDRGDEVRAAFWRLVRDHPLAFIVNRLRTYRYLMAIPAHLYRLDYVDEQSAGFDPLAAAAGYHYIRRADSPAIAIELANKSFVNWPVVQLLMRPWFLLVALALASLITIASRGSFPIPLVSVAVLGIGYYATFFVVSGGAAFRYYFPSFVLLQLVAAAAVISAGRAIRLRLLHPM